MDIAPVLSYTFVIVGVALLVLLFVLRAFLDASR